jgi:hypothetical protein
MHSSIVAAWIIFVGLVCAGFLAGGLYTMWVAGPIVVVAVIISLAVYGIVSELRR